MCSKRCCDSSFLDISVYFGHQISQQNRKILLQSTKYKVQLTNGEYLPNVLKVSVKHSFVL